jgi:hypothetical protein
MLSSSPLTESGSVRTALKELRGRATVGDVVARTGLARPEVEEELRELLGNLRGHLEVGESGTLVYRFDPKLVRRDTEPLWDRVKRTAWRWFQAAFKVWIVLMLVVYVVVFVALLLAAVFAGRDDGDRIGGGRRRGGYRHQHGGLTDLLFWYWLWSPGWRRRPYYGHRFPYEAKDKRDRVPFYKKVFAFVFGPDEPHPTQSQKDRSVVRLIRARQGVLTVAELMQHTGLERPAAEEEMARLMTAYDGDIRVSDGGELVYLFPDLMVSAHGKVRERGPDPAWRRLETPKSLTGNERTSDLIIGGLNAFNLAAAATAPLFIFPRLGLGGAAAWVGLVFVPLVFSVMFFGIPLARLWALARANAKRAARNVRKVVMGFVYGSSLKPDGPEPVRVPELTSKVSETMRDAGPDPRRVEEALQGLAAEFDADVEPGPDGTLEFRFADVRRQFQAAAAMRSELALERQEVGEIVYSSADTTEEAYERDAEAFDRALEDGRARAVTDDLTRYIEAPEQVGYVEDWDLLAFEEEMRRRGQREKVAR